MDVRSPLVTKEISATIRRFLAPALLALGLVPALSGAEDYEVGPGDTLGIVVLGHADLSGEYRVDQDGLINLPILGKVKAAELTAAELERKLTTLLADGYLKRPQISVAVKEYGSQKVFVTGEVPRPGPYPLKADRSLLALLGDIGSLTGNAGHEIVVIRPARGASGPLLPLDAAESTSTSDPLARGTGLAASNSEVFRISLAELQAGNPERNILLQAGDTVYVPKASQVYVTGSVARPGPYRYQDGMTVLQALTLAGGATERGSTGRTRIVRVEGGRKVEVKAKLSDLLRPEDTLLVPERFF